MSETTQKAQLLEDYGNAAADAVLLNVLLQSVASSSDTPPGVDATIVRSINRAEREMYEVKARYEEPTP